MQWVVDYANFVKQALVVDPVMVSTSGDVLAGSSVLASFRYFLKLKKNPFTVGT